MKIKLKSLIAAAVIGSSAYANAIENEWVYEEEYNTASIVKGRFIIGVNGNAKQFFISTVDEFEPCKGKLNEVLITMDYTVNNIPLKMETRCLKKGTVAMPIKVADYDKIIGEFSGSSSVVFGLKMTNENLFEVSTLGFNKAIKQLR